MIAVNAAQLGSFLGTVCGIPMGGAVTHREALGIGEERWG